MDNLKRTRKTIVLTKVVDESAMDLRAMVAELCIGKFEKDGDGMKASHWARRFAASGKQVPAPKIRLR
jgi:hypothetical protein